MFLGGGGRRFFLVIVFEIKDSSEVVFYCCRLGIKLVNVFFV